MNDHSKEYKRVWQEESAQLRGLELFSHEEVLNLIRSGRQSQYKQHCRSRRRELLMGFVAVILEIAIMWELAMMGSWGWFAGMALVMMLSVVGVGIVVYDLYLLRNMNPVKCDTMRVEKYSQRFNALDARRCQWLEKLGGWLKMGIPYDYSIKWVRMAGTMGCVAMAAVMVLLWNNGEESPLVAQKMDLPKEVTMPANHQWEMDDEPYTEPLEEEEEPKIVYRNVETEMLPHSEPSVAESNEEEAKDDANVDAMMNYRETSISAFGSFAMVRCNRH